jgi:peptide/nickel transport system permease protein
MLRILSKIKAKLKGRHSIALSLACLSLFAVLAVVGPLFTPYDPWAFTFNRLEQPSLQHIFGTDQLGRDVFSRILYATRASMIVAFSSAPISFAIGTVLGALAGYYGGVFDSIISRISDSTLSIPRFLLMILLTTLYGKSLINIILIIALTLWPENFRIMRAQVLTLRTRPFVESAQTAGGSNLYICFRHIVPNGIAPVISNASFQMALSLLYEAAMSFIGLGDPSQITWGYVMYEGGRYLQSAWWIATFAGIPITILSSFFIFLSNRLTEILEPR